MNRADCPAENTIAAFADGSLPPDDMARVESHAGTCVHCQQLLGVASGVGRSGPALARGTTIGRYTILSLVGQGGMGEVYAAYDPELDRKVALKLLRSDGTRDAETGHARLLREAKAMARVSHPNVVAVHDAGTFGARVFLAMEFVDGPTVRAWLAERPRAYDEVLAVFLQAAQGLMAAHAAGLVHRDFKPGNVMIARDGRVRVTDFGIARSLAEKRDEVDGDGDLLMAGADAHQTLTATGQLMGTPRYMAPEQFRAAATDARTDQFSFCVALYETLYGASPFGEGNVASLAAEVLAGRVRPAPAKSSVPEWQRRVLLRGLSVSPDDRWPSMRELVAALTQDSSRSRRRWALAIGAALLVAIPTIVLVRQSGRAASLCRGGTARISDAWEVPGSSGEAHPRRAAVEHAFLTSGVPGATEVWHRVAARLDRYAAGWLAMYDDACAATHVHGSQPASVLDLRMSCLNDRRTALMALTDVFTRADREIVGRGVDAVDALPLLERCGDLEALRTHVEPPRDEATRIRVTDLRLRLAGAKALHDAGKRLKAQEIYRRVVDEARDLGYPPVLAESLGGLADTFVGLAEETNVVPLGDEAVWTTFSTGNDELAANAAVARAGIAYHYAPDLAECRYWLKLAGALIERAGPKQDRLRSWLLHTAGMVEERANDFSTGLRLMREATALKEKILPSGHPDVAISLNGQAENLHLLGQNEAALAINQRAYDLYVAAYGHESVEAAYTLSNRGEYLLALARPADALAASRDALSRWEAHTGPDHQNLGYPLMTIGRSLRALGRTKEAVPPLERALHVREPTHTPPELVAEAHLELAQALADAGLDVRRARTLATSARDIYRRAANKERADAADAWLEARQRPRQAR